ncbi:hypothetical protein LXA43DRAFT_1066367 [Ganoderma leucocontextum]|nr:hypothetical protein LXA43DRAFT_1066367 [Ganoderma leucocontextum]
MSKNRHATPEQIQEACELYSKLYYGFKARTSPDLAPGFDAFFKDRLRALGMVLSASRLQEIPGFLLAVLWENNLVAAKAKPAFDYNAISLVKDYSHACFQDAGRVQTLKHFKILKDGEVKLLPETQLTCVWWQTPVLPGPQGILRAPRATEGWFSSAGLSTGSSAPHLPQQMLGPAPSLKGPPGLPARLYPGGPPATSYPSEEDNPMEGPSSARGRSPSVASTVAGSTDEPSSSKTPRGRSQSSKPLTSPAAPQKRSRSRASSTPPAKKEKATVNPASTSLEEAFKEPGQWVDRWIPHANPCDGCQKRNKVCYVAPAHRTTCARRYTLKEGCSLSFKGDNYLKRYRTYVYVWYSLNPTMWQGDLTSQGVVTEACKECPAWFKAACLAVAGLDLPRAPEVALDSPRPWPLEVTAAQPTPNADHPTVPPKANAKGKQRATTAEPRKHHTLNPGPPAAPQKKNGKGKQRANTEEPTEPPPRRFTRSRSRASSIATLPPSTSSAVSTPGPPSPPPQMPSSRPSSPSPERDVAMADVLSDEYADLTAASFRPMPARSREAPPLLAIPGPSGLSAERSEGRPAIQASAPFVPGGSWCNLPVMQAAPWGAGLFAAPPIPEAYLTRIKTLEDKVLTLQDQLQAEKQAVSLLQEQLGTARRSPGPAIQEYLNSFGLTPEVLRQLGQSNRRRFSFPGFGWGGPTQRDADEGASGEMEGEGGVPALDQAIRSPDSRRECATGTPSATLADLGPAGETSGGVLAGPLGGIPGSFSANTTSPVLTIAGPAIPATLLGMSPIATLVIPGTAAPGIVIALLPANTIAALPATPTRLPQPVPNTLPPAIPGAPSPAMNSGAAPLAIPLATRERARTTSLTGAGDGSAAAPSLVPQVLPLASSPAFFPVTPSLPLAANAIPPSAGGDSPWSGEEAVPPQPTISPPPLPSDCNGESPPVPMSSDGPHPSILTPTTADGELLPLQQSSPPPPASDDAAM